MAHNGTEMKQHMRALQNDPQLAAALARHGLETIRKHHSCAHRVDELLKIYGELPGRAAKVHEPIGVAANLPGVHQSSAPNSAEETTPSRACRPSHTEVAA